MTHISLVRIYQQRRTLLVIRFFWAVHGMHQTVHKTYFKSTQNAVISLKIKEKKPHSQACLYYIRLNDNLLHITDQM
jgi:3-phenylpropionate/cinnamic acid dioxygenase small subunit